MSKFYLTIILLTTVPFICLSDNQYPKPSHERKIDQIGSIAGTDGIRINNHETVRKKPSQQRKNYHKALWQAAMEYLGPRHIVSSHYEGGSIVTDWYHEGGYETKVLVLIKGRSLSDNAISVKVWSRIHSKEHAHHNIGRKQELEKDIKEAILKLAKEYLV